MSGNDFYRRRASKPNSFITSSSSLLDDLYDESICHWNAYPSLILLVYTAMFSGDTNEAVEGLFQPIHAKQMARVEQSTTSSSSSRDYDKQNNIDTASV